MTTRKLVLGLVAVLLPAIVAGMGVVLLTGVLVASGSSDGDGSFGEGYRGGGGICQITPSALGVTEAGSSGEMYGRSEPLGGDNDQLYNAAVILSVGATRGLSRRDQQIALMFAMKQSHLKNLDYGAGDATGLFQQSPSMGGGTADQLHDPAYAAGVFFTSLVAITSRDSMPLPEVAQQVPPFDVPDAYIPYEAAAQAVVDAIYNDAAATICTLVSGGMTKSEADTFMSTYKYTDPGTWDLRACGCSGNCIANCVSFSTYFINRYSTQQVPGATGDGRDVAWTMATWWSLPTGNIPRAYAIFSDTNGSLRDEYGIPYGHTGVVLGIDEANNQIIIGEAACNQPGFTGAHVYLLSDWTAPNFIYAYTDSILIGDPGGS
jgi:hypothetical protein